MEAIFDPITAVRNWAYTRGSSGDYLWAGAEWGRDEMARGMGLFGYRFFAYSGGCYYQRFRVPGWKEHILPPWGGTGPRAAAEAPFRPATNSTSTRGEHDPTAWIAVCHTPVTGTATSSVSPPRPHAPAPMTTVPRAMRAERAGSGPAGSGSPAPVSSARAESARTIARSEACMVRIRW